MKEIDYRMVKTLMTFWFGFLLIFAAGIHAAEITKDAKRHMARGHAAAEYFEETKDVNNIKDAVREFKKAIQMAPDWADAWYNLGAAQEAARAYADAMQSFKKYLKLNPNAADSGEVEARIFKLEYKQEEQAKRATRPQVKKPVKKTEKTFAEKLNGRWVEMGGGNWGGPWFYPPDIYEIRISGNQMKIVEVASGQTNKQGKMKYHNATNIKIFQGNLGGHHIAGTWYFYNRNLAGNNPSFKIDRNYTGRVDGNMNLSADGSFLQITFKRGTLSFDKKWLRK